MYFNSIGLEFTAVIIAALPNTTWFHYIFTPLHWPVQQLWLSWIWDLLNWKTSRCCVCISCILLHTIYTSTTCYIHARNNHGMTAGVNELSTSASSAPDHAPVFAHNAEHPGPLHDELVRPQKIWGLRLVDMRLLWTVDIRDSLYAFVSR